MSRRIRVEIVGDADKLERSFKQASSAANSFGRNAKQSANSQVQAAVRQDAALRREVVSYREIASAAKRGSREQIAATRLAAKSEEKLSRSLGVTAREQRVFAASSARAERQFSRFGRGALAGSGAFRSLGRSIAFASAGYLSFAAAAHGVRSSILAASDLTEEINKSNVVFRGSEKQVQSWSRRLIPAFGLTRAEGLRTAAVFGNMLVPMGFIRRQAAQMSERLVSLAGDLASFNNANPEETLKALQAGLANQPRPLRRFGVFLSQARIEAEALSSGIVRATKNMGKIADAQTKVDIAQARLAQSRKKFGANSIEAASAETRLHAAERALGKELAGNVPKLTNAQRTLAIYRIILKDTADAQGDAAKTGGEFAGQMRKLHAETGNLEEQIGRLLMPTTLRYTRSLTDWLSKSRNQAKVTRDAKEAVHIFASAISTATDVLVPMARGAQLVARAVGGWKNAFKIITSLYLANKFLRLAAAIRESRLAMLTFGGAGRTASGSIAANAAVMAGAMNAPLGRIGRLRRALIGLSRLAPIVIGIDLIINKDDRQKALKFLKGTPGSQQNKSLQDLVHVGQGIADAATQVAHGNVGHSGHTLGFNAPPPTKKQAEATSEATKLRKANYGGDYIYRQLRSEGYSSQQASYAVTASRRSPRSRRAPSPEDARSGIRSSSRPTAGPAAVGQPTTPRRRHRRFTEKASSASRGFELPMRLQVAEAKADASRSESAILKVAREIKAFLLKAIPHLKGQKLITAYGLLGQANDTIASAAKEAADKAKADAARAKEKLRAAREKMQQAVENVRSQLGELFQGPVLAPTDWQVKAKLGVPGPKVPTLTADLRAQTAQFARFDKDLAILAKRGAPKELLKELRAKGPEALPEIEALAKASRKDLLAFFKAFGKRELEIRRVAKVELNAAHVNIKAAHLTITGLHHQRAHAQPHRGARIRQMATGGVAMKPMLAEIGERGPEAVVPLPRGLKLPSLGAIGSELVLRRIAGLLSQILATLKGRPAQRTRPAPGAFALSHALQERVRVSAQASRAPMPRPHLPRAAEPLRISARRSAEETHIHNIYLDGQKIARNVTTRQQRATKSSAPQVRGRHLGSNPMGPG